MCSTCSDKYLRMLERNSWLVSKLHIFNLDLTRMSIKKLMSRNKIMIYQKRISSVGFSVHGFGNNHNRALHIDSRSCLVLNLL